MIVEDDSDFSALLTMILKQLGHDVQSAATGEEAIRLYSCSFPDLIFLDMQLPDISGYDVANKIHANGEAHSVIIGLTAFSPWQIAKELEGSGIAFCIQKPMGFSELSDALMKMILEVREKEWEPKKILKATTKLHRIV